MRMSRRITLGPGASPAEPLVEPLAPVIRARPVVLSRLNAPEERLLQFGWLRMFVTCAPTRKRNRSSWKLLNRALCITRTAGP